MTNYALNSEEELSRAKVSREKVTSEWEREETASEWEREETTSEWEEERQRILSLTDDKNDPEPLSAKERGEDSRLSKDLTQMVISGVRPKPLPVE